jgi:putative nucleotidyltransferase with HDIG domain
MPKAQFAPDPTMDSPFRLGVGDADDRAKVEEWLGEFLDQLAADVRERTVTAWLTAWRSSPYATLEEIPAGRAAKRHRLTDHILEVTRCGLQLSLFAESEWSVDIDRENLLCILLLHDVDKPLVMERQGEEVVFSELGRRIPHGVLGAMLLRELGFSETVVNTVATHAETSPFRADYLEAWVLNYADYFATDYVLLAAGETADYQKGPGR